MPKIDAKFDLGVWWWLLFGVVVMGRVFLWLDGIESVDSFCTAGISYPSGFVFPFALWGVGF